jgi:glycosyltransferase involved in cell wall biosynthesis
MSKKTAYIISLKFAPGLKKEFVVIGENLRKYGFDVKYIISNLYSYLDFNCDGMNFINTKDGIKGMIFDTIKYFSMEKIMDIINNAPPSFVLFYNPHPLNPRFCYFIKKNFPNAILSLYLHDPYKPDKSYYGFKKGIYMNIAEFIQGLSIKYMDYVISPSEYSSELFKKRFPNFKGKNYIAPLLVPDQHSNSNKERKYFSMVGGAHLATGHDTFIELVNYVAEKNLSYEFFLISSSNISIFLKKLTEKGKKILKIINKPIIKDTEINQVISESYAVFRLDKEVTQSGVIPVSYMNRTPVIARDIPGLRQHVWDKKTGYIVPFNSSLDDIIKAMEFIRDNFHELSKNARQKYEEIWAEWNFDKYYKWLINH